MEGHSAKALSEGNSTARVAQSTQEASTNKPEPIICATFVVDSSINVGDPIRSLPPESLTNAWNEKGKLESCSQHTTQSFVTVFSERNIFAEAVHKAFYEHYPLIFSPDLIWTVIAQGFAHHVDQNAEKLRKKFVSHEGKVKIVISEPTFVKGSPNNDWESVFPKFSDEISKHVGRDTVDLIECNFSTTGPVERVVSHVVLMDTVQHYFEYEMMCGCGIPSITLLGTVEDWEHIRAKAGRLAAFDDDLSWWMDELLPVLDEFVKAARGVADIAFWMSICRLSGLSGMPGDPITGWLQVFFPYLNNSGRNRGLGNYKESLLHGATVSKYNEWKTLRSRGRGDNENVHVGYGVDLEDIPPSLSSAPFTYYDLNTGESYDMRFMGGLVGIVQDASTLALEPKFGWAVLEI